MPRVLLYDNLKSVVLERVGEAIRFHPTLLELAAPLSFPTPPRGRGAGQRKGRVERAIRFAREAFFAARTFRDLDDLNAQALTWCQGAAAERPCPEDRARTVRELFTEEQSQLLALPDDPFPTEERLEVSVRKSPYVRFDANDYSISHTHVHRTLLVAATLETVRILDADQVIATHPRSFERGAQIEVPAHLEALVTYKRTARTHRAQDRLQQAAPSTKTLCVRAAERGVHLGVLTRGLLQLLDTHGAMALEAAIAAALAEDAAHLGAVRHFIDQHHNARKKPPPIAVTLPEDPGVRTLSVRPQPLSDYEQLCLGNE